MPQPIRERGAPLGCSMDVPRTILITDACAPVGRATAVRLGRAGWNLVLGGASMSSLRGVCAELPDPATLPLRCDVTDADNLLPVLASAEDRFGQVDAVLYNSRARCGGWVRTLNAQVGALARTADLLAPVLHRSAGRFVIAGHRAGSRTLDDAVHTVSRDAVRTIAEALDADWETGAHSVALVEPRGAERPRDMARRIARILNGGGDMRAPLAAQTLGMSR